jgi:hypothetical protein
MAQEAAVSGQPELDQLRQQLAAQKVINAQLMRRLADLQAQLSGEPSPDVTTRSRLNDLPSKPRDEMNEPEQTSALEEALVSKGLVLLPVGAGRVTPSVTWAHRGQGSSRADSSILGVVLETGLPNGAALSFGLPYIWRDFAQGSHQGRGDVSLALAKKFTQETETQPALVGKFSYTHDNGHDPFTLPAIGNGFKSYALTLSAFKRMEPLVLYGNVSYAWSRGRDATLIDRRSGQVLYQGHIQPGDGRGLALGVSLAATPSVSLDMGLSLQWLDRTRYQPEVDSVRSTVGYVNLGANFLVSKNLSVNLGASAGVTQGASDLVISVAMPYRF